MCFTDNKRIYNKALNYISTEILYIISNVNGIDLNLLKKGYSFKKSTYEEYRQKKAFIGQSKSKNSIIMVHKVLTYKVG